MTSIVAGVGVALVLSACSTTRPTVSASNERVVFAVTTEPAPASKIGFFQIDHSNPWIRNAPRLLLGAGAGAYALYENDQWPFDGDTDRTPRQAATIPDGASSSIDARDGATVELRGRCPSHIAASGPGTAVRTTCADE